MKKRVIKITIVEYVRDEKKEEQQEESKTGLKMNTIPENVFWYCG